jgi:hypothetical protein
MTDQMKINKATITFIYSFLPALDDMRYDDTVIKMLVDSKIASKENGGRKPSDSHLLTNRLGLSSYLLLNQNMGYDIDYEFTGYLKDDPNLKLIIQPLFRFFSFGCSLTFHVTCSRIGESISSQDVYKVLQIISTEGNKKANQRFVIEKQGDMPIEKKEYSLYNFFRNRLEEKLKKANETEEVKNAKSGTIRLICLDEGIIDDTVDLEVIVPWVITSIETKDKDVTDALLYHNNKISRAESVAEKLNRISPHEASIAPILFRAVDPDIDAFKIEPSYDSFSLDSDSNGLYNMYIDARFYLNMSRRSIFTLCKSLNEKPASYLLPTLFDINEVNHTRWQALIVLNMILDKHISSVSDHSNEGIDSGKNLEDVLMLLKKVLANLENISSYVVSGDSLREISEKLVDTYKIEELSRHALSKINLLDKVYHLKAEIEFRKNYKNYDK